MFFHALEISVCANNNRLYFCSGKNKLIEGSHLPHNLFLHQEQKHQEIHCKTLTHMTTLEISYICQNSHSYCKMQHLYHVNESVIHKIMQHHYIWKKYFLRLIVSLIPLLINFRYSLYIAVAAYANS